MRLRVSVLVLCGLAACSDGVPVPSELAQASLAPAEALGAGAETCSQPLRLTALLAHPDGLSSKLEVELRPVGEALSGARTHESASLPAGSRAAVELAGLSPGLGYHWAARAVDAEGEASAWTEFGGNAAGAADFALCAEPLAFVPATVRIAAPAGVDTAGWTVHAGVYSSGPVAGGAVAVLALDEPQLVFAVNGADELVLMALKGPGATEVSLGAESTVQALAVLSGVLAMEYADAPRLVQLVLDESTDLDAAALILGARLAQGAGALADAAVIEAALAGAAGARDLLESRRPREWVRITPNTVIDTPDGIRVEKVGVTGGVATFTVTNSRPRHLEAYIETEDGTTEASIGPASLELKLKLPPRLPAPSTKRVTFPMNGNGTALLRFYGLGAQTDAIWTGDAHKLRVLKPAVNTIVKQFVVPILSLLVSAGKVDKALTPKANQKFVDVILKESLLVQKITGAKVPEIIVKLVTKCVTAVASNEDGIATELFATALKEGSVAVLKYLIPVFGQLKLAADIGEKLSQLIMTSASVYTAHPLTVIVVDNEEIDGAALRASTYEGFAPLRVTLTALTPWNIPIRHYRWDYEGDGEWDFDADALSEVTHTYAKEGKIWPRVQVTDADGATTVIEVSDPLNVLVAHLEVTEGRLQASGPQGGPFTPEALELYLRSSVEGTDLPWRATVTTPQPFGSTDWVTVTPSSSAPPGRRAGREYTKVTVALDPAHASALPAGSHLVLVNFLDVESNSESSRIVTLDVGAPVSVLPSTDIAVEGPAGGPFSPDAESYTLTADGATVDFTAAVDVPWLDLSASSGKATPAGAAIGLRLNSLAATLAPATDAYEGRVRFRYASSGAVFATRLFAVTVVGTEAVGEPDPSFAADGTVHLGAQASARALSRGPGETILVAGLLANSPAVWRFAGDGASDSTFGAGGVVTYAMTQRRVTDMATDSVGRIVIVGTASLPVDNLFVMRVLADGRTDPSFGQGGVFTVQMGSNTDAYAYAVAIDAQDRPVISGYTWPSTGGGLADLALWRLTAGGALDTSFAGKGYIQRANLMGTSMPGVTSEEAAAVAIDGQGRIVVTGMADTENGDAMILMRFHADGAPDLGFAGQGWLFDKPTLQVTGSALALDASGRIVVGGQMYVGGPFYQSLWRWTASGTLDTSFAGTGRATFGAGTVFKLLVDGTGKLLFASRAAVGGSVFGRCTEAGVLDTTFGGGDGLVPLSASFPYDLVLDGSGRILFLAQNQVMLFK